MRGDHYARSGRRWALGAELVYRPIAAELVAMSPHCLAGRIVLDAGAGVGAASSALTARHARALALDLSPGMLAWNATVRPPSAVADIRVLPLARDSVDDAVAAFVLNHLTDPVPGLAELARVTRPGGAVLAAVFSNDSHSQARDRIDATALAAGCQVPGWYAELKTTAARILGSRAGMAAAARRAGLADVHADERPVNVGITAPRQLVRYRLGHPIFAGWLDAIGTARPCAANRQEVSALRRPVWLVDHRRPFPGLSECGRVHRVAIRDVKHQGPCSKGTRRCGEPGRGLAASSPIRHVIRRGSMYRTFITRLAAVAAAGATAVLLAGAAQASTGAAAGTVSGTEHISGVVFGKDAIASSPTYPLTFTGLVRTTSLFTPPSGNGPAVLPTPKGGLGAQLVRPMRFHVISTDRRTCYGVFRFSAALRVVTRLSTGVFKGATGKGAVAITQGAHFGRGSSGACNFRGNPVSGRDAFNALAARIALTLRR